VQKERRANHLLPAVHNATFSSAAIGIVANPASGRDIRRLTAKASVFPTAEKANMVQRMLGAFGCLGVERVLMMPDRTGIAAGVLRAVDSHRAERLPPWPQLEFVDLDPTDTPADTVAAVRAMRAAGVEVIVVLGGDGTHRVVAAECGETPLATLSSGTNNAFPELREATLTGLAAALVATGRVPREAAVRRNKVLRVAAGGREEIALVDVCVTRDAHLGARAVWDAGRISELFVTFAEPAAIGLSAIASMLQLVGRDDDHGYFVRCAAPGRARQEVLAAIAPGVLATVGIAEAGWMEPGMAYPIRTPGGTVALDGEREIELAGGMEASVRLDAAGPLTVDVPATLEWAVRAGVMTAPWRGGA